jgi:hypothetical protein
MIEASALGTIVRTVVVSLLELAIEKVIKKTGGSP